MTRAKTLLFASTLMALPGCTRTLDVTGITPSGSRTGIGYVLPFTQYEVTATWRLDQCYTETEVPGQPGKLTKANIPPKIAMKVEAAQGSADDGRLAFMVNPQDLQSPTSITTFSAKWHDGRNLFSTIGASVEDRSAQIVGNVVKTAVKVLPLAMGMPPGLLPPGSSAPTCTEKAAADLEAAKAAKGLLEARTQDLERATAAYKATSERITALGASVGESAKTELDEALKALGVAKRRQDAATEALTEAVKSITYTRKFRWPQNGDTFSREPEPLPKEVWQRWVSGADDKYITRPVYLQIERIGTFGRRPPRTNLTRPRNLAGSDERISPLPESAGDQSYRLPPAEARGLRYRMPAAGRLVACWRSPCGSEDPEGVIASFDGPVVQLGYVNVLPFRSRAFGSNSFAAEFALDGSLKSVGYEQKAAPGEAISGAMADAAGQLAPLFDPTARLQTGTAYLKALKEQRDALEALKPKAEDPLAAQTASLNADTAFINAQRANVEAYILLEEQRAKRQQGG
ncbi:MAG TPA: hypothetical protein VF631_07370 [Allosphingosinicella sp.]|jgi:hypothetical protein|uniref:hypothetical protein n=1 Tax=Allosphingosinicella sp. TaxID=2823234 RepID=UPI002F298D76